MKLTAHFLKRCSSGACTCVCPPLDEKVLKKFEYPQKIYTSSEAGKTYIDRIMHTTCTYMSCMYQKMSNLIDQISNILRCSTF